MSLSVAGRENIKTVGSKNASKTFVGDHWEKYWGFVGMGWDSRCALGIGPEIGRENFKIGRWDWDYENRHWADTGSSETNSVKKNLASELFIFYCLFEIKTPPYF